MLSPRGTAAIAIFALVGVCSRVEAAEAAVPPTRVATTAPITNPCLLLTQAEATEVLGQKLGTAEITHPLNGLRCRYVTPISKQTGTSEELFLDVATPMMFAAYSEMSVTKVPGIGDTALWVHNQFGTYLHIKKGSNYVTLGLPPTFTTLTPAIVKAGKLMASRM